MVAIVFVNSQENYAYVKEIFSLVWHLITLSDEFCVEMFITSMCCAKLILSLDSTFDTIMHYSKILTSSILPHRNDSVYVQSVLNLTNV